MVKESTNLNKLEFFEDINFSGQTNTLTGGTFAEFIAFNSSVMGDQRLAILWYLVNKWKLDPLLVDDNSGQMLSKDSKRIFNQVSVNAGQGSAGPAQFNPNDLGEASQWVRPNGLLNLVGDGCVQATRENPIIMSGRFVLKQSGTMVISSDCSDQN